MARGHTLEARNALEQALRVIRQIHDISNCWRVFLAKDRRKRARRHAGQTFRSAPLPAASGRTIAPVRHPGQPLQPALAATMIVV